MKLAALYWEETDKMKQFMDKNFLLDTATAKHLFHDYAEHMPIIDYHCHISPQEIAEDHHFRSITEVWLGGDHYKWRLIRSNGTPGRKGYRDRIDRLWQKIRRICESSFTSYWQSAVSLESFGTAALFWHYRTADGKECRRHL